MFSSELEALTKLTRLGALAVVAIELVGCAGASSFSNPFLSSGPQPRAEDCALIQQATPAKFVCNGKTYTAIQLMNNRLGQPQMAKLP